MAWFNWGKGKKEKLNPAQEQIHWAEGTTVSTRESKFNYRKQYEDLEIVNRGINMIIDDASEIEFVVGESQVLTAPSKGLRKVTLNRLLNIEPNPFQDISTFKRNLLVDLLVDGNIFIYFDGAHLYHLPAEAMTIYSDKETYIDYYMFNGADRFETDEIIHIKENSFYSIYRGIPRLKPASRTMKLLTSMRDFQDKFFENGAVTGLVVKSPNTLSQKIKDRMVQSWQANYNPTGGGKRPMILDGGLDVDPISNVNFKELDFQSSIAEYEKTILKALGVPPILLDGGNNSNIRPNHRLFYLETILPIVNKLNSAIGRFFGYKITSDLTKTPALQPELKELASYHTTLTNGGIFTPNEARMALGKDKLDGLDDIRVPTNIAGSAVDPGTGGKPSQGDNNDQKN